MIPKITPINGKKIEYNDEIKEVVSETDLTDNHSGKNNEYLLSNVQIRDYIDEIMKKDENE